ncbi:hypothetical protein AB205_0027780, partial [Aquarana catesbeiana]
ILCCLLILGITGSPVCVHQVKTRTVQSGGSVTIPCSYVNPRKPDEDVRVIWGETDGEYCSSGKDIIVSSSGKVTEKYKGRLYREKDPYRNRTEYITITGLESTKRQRFCCQLYNMSHNYVFKDSIQGTLLQFTGEEVIIPCFYSKDASTLTKVTWYYAKEHNMCTDTRIQEWSKAHQYGRYSVVNFTQDVSLRILNIKLYDQQNYQSSWDQPTNEISVQEGHSVLLSCSYTLPSGRYTERDVLRVNVYWRVGNVTGPYAYHPYEEMVHSTYKHRTSITGMTNLMIKDVMKADNTSFHCFLVVKLCEGNNQDEDKIQYGGGTRLIIKDTEYITQLDEVMAVSGEEVIIPCYYSKNTSTLTKVTWYYAKEHTTCTDTRIQEWSNAHQYGRYSVVNFKQDVSLRIHNIKLYDQQSFCCVISTSNKGETLESKQFTMLIVADYQPSWDQPTNEISVQEGHSVLLSCSYTLPSDQYTERDVLRVNVYWRVGNVTGLYAYHPYQEMVHSTYRHRTSITEMINLMIKGVTKADNTSFYCFVVVKLCKGDNQCEDKIQYGGGTKLNINEPPQMSHIGRETLILAAYLAVKFFFTVILVVLGCVYGRAKSTKRST